MRLLLYRTEKRSPATRQRGTGTTRQEPLATGKSIPFIARKVKQQTVAMRPGTLLVHG